MFEFAPGVRKDWAIWQRIGIIGGLGPRASAHFYRLLVELCSQQYCSVQDSDYPPMFIVNLASEGLSQTGVVNETVLLAEIRETLRLFDSLDVRVVALPCNSVYAYFDQFQQYTQAQVINLPEEIALAATELQAKDIGILCSQGLRTARAYDPYFLARGIEPYYPEEAIQELIDRWILEVMGGDHTEKTVARLLDVVNKLSCQHDAVVLACSELCVLVDASSLPPSVINSCRVLAEATLRSSSGGIV